MFIVSGDDVGCFSLSGISSPSDYAWQALRAAMTVRGRATGPGTATSISGTRKTQCAYSFRIKLRGIIGLRPELGKGDLGNICSLLQQIHR